MFGPAPFVLVEDRLDKAAPACLYRDPVEIIRCDDPATIPSSLGRIEAVVAQGLHAAGFMSFELGYAFEPRLGAALDRPRDLPLLWFGLFHAPKMIAAAELDALFVAAGPPPPIREYPDALDATAYQEKVEGLLAHIDLGDVYQVNLTFQKRFEYHGDPLALYGAMRAHQPVSHGAVVAFDDKTILSVSPELFIEVSNGLATARPMKGTAPRGADPATDAAARKDLAADIKQLAENLMIVDLLRNDLARVSRPGSVQVPRAFEVETYPTLHTMTSTITARLREGLPLAALLGATFPCGSVVGAPKHRASELIQRLETEPRGVYTGSIGTIAPGGALRFNVAIRTAVIDGGGQGSYGIGGGIVADSTPAAEYAECLLKARVLTDLAADYGLIETLAWLPGMGFQRLAMHLDRLGNSARSLGFSFDRRAAETRLSALAATLTDARRVRLELRRGGSLEIAAPALPPEPDRVFRVGIAGARVDAGDPFLRHKTTRRALYEDAFAIGAAQGLDEVILLNRDGQVTEAARNNIFVAIDGRLVTPPLSAGLLPGVLRQALLDTGEAIEGGIGLDDLRDRRWYLGNSLRGLRQAVLA